MIKARRIELFRDCRHQLIRILAELELRAEEALIRHDGARLIIQPLRQSGLSALLAEMNPIDEIWPDIADPPAAPETIF